MRAGKPTHKRLDVDGVLRQIAKLIGDSTDAGIARRLGISAQAIYNARKRGSIPYEKLMDFAVKEGFDLNFLLFGLETANPLMASAPAPCKIDEQLLGIVAASLRSAVAGHGDKAEMVARSLSVIASTYNFVVQRLPIGADVQSVETRRAVNDLVEVLAEGLKISVES